MAQITEAEIIKGCIQNDRISQKLLFEKYKNAMYATAFRILNNKDVAHDALQESFIEVFKNIAGLRNHTALSGWIKTTVVRKALYRLKSEKEFEPLSKANEIVSHELQADYTSEDLDRAIRSLPESARAVFLLVEVEGYKHSEVAEMLNISVGTSKSQLYYSKQLLKKKLIEIYQM